VQARVGYRDAQTNGYQGKCIVWECKPRIKQMSFQGGTELKIDEKTQTGA